MTTRKFTKPIKGYPHKRAKRNGSSPSGSTKQINQSLKTLSEVRKEMGERIEAFIKGGNEGKVLNLQVPAGAGKSHTATQMINSLFPTGNDILWFASMHDQFDDLGELRKTNWVHVRGRTSGDGSTLQNCKHAEKARLLYNRGLSVPGILCKKCDIGKCEYWSKFREKGHKFLPHQMLFFFDGADTPLVVFDELNIKIFLDTYTLDAKELVRLAKAGNEDFWEAFIHLLVEDNALSGKDLYVALRKHLNAMSLTQVREHIQSLEFNDKVDTYNLETSPIIGVGQTVRDIVWKEINMVIGGQSFNPRIHINPKHDKIYREHLELSIRRPTPEWLKDKPIILLGAKGEQELFQKVLGKTSTDFIPYVPKIELPKQVEIVKGDTEFLPQSTLDTAKNKTLVWDAIGENIDTDLKTCLICHQPHEEAFSKLFGLEMTDYENDSYHDTGHFWGVRGLNKWKDYEQIIVIGTPTPNLDDMMRQIQTIYWDESVLDITREEVNGIPDFKDDRIKWYLHCLREDEIYQAVFRIRPLEVKSRGKIKIIIATSIPLEDIDSYISQRFEIPTTRKKKLNDKLATLEETANHLLDTVGSFNRKTLSDEVVLRDKSIDYRFVARNWKQLKKDLNLTQVPDIYPHSLKRI